MKLKKKIPLIDQHDRYGFWGGKFGGNFIPETLKKPVEDLTKEFSKLIPTSLVIIFYSVSFYFLSIAVVKLPLTIVYASWTGLGVVSVAILSYYFYKQPLNLITIIGLFMIVIGVVLVNVFKTD